MPHVAGQRLWQPVAAATALALALALLAAGLSARLADSELGAPRPAGTAEVAGYGKLPLAFQPNAGRYPGEVAFVSASAAGAVALTDRGIAFTQASGEGAAETIELRLPGAALGDAAGRGRLPGVVNDLRGDDPARWSTGIPTFAGVRYASAYPGIDVEVHGRAGAPEYDFRLAPGADPSRIELRFAGADSLRIAPRGDLVVRAGDATFRQRAPVAYQPAAGGARPVDARFVLDGRTVGFDLGRYDRSRPLVIDPLVLAYSTYLGGAGVDSGEAIAVDATGAAYVAGSTLSTDFDVRGAVQADQGGFDAFVAKLSPAGDALVYATYLGGSAVDSAAGIAVDATGAAYVTGETASSNFPTANAIQGTIGGGPDVYVAKLNAAGSALVYSTYLGGTLYESGFEIAIDGAGAAYVTGETLSVNFPAVNAIQANNAGKEDAFVAKLNPAGSALAYSTYLGGTDADGATGIAVDGTGAAYLGGGTNSTNFPTVGAIEGDSASTDAFLAKVAPAGTALAYSTYLGGGGSDLARAVAVDPTGAAYLAGHTTSADFDAVAAIEGPSGGRDVFVSKVVAAGNALAYSTYLGGPGDDSAEDVAVDAAGAAYIAGEAGPGFDTAEPIEGDSAQEDAFAARLTPAGSGLGFSTYLGGSGQDAASAIAVDAAGDAYVFGDTRSTDFDTVGAIEGDSGLDDLFIAKVHPVVPAPPGTTPPDTTPPETTITKAPKSRVETRRKRARVRFKFRASEPGATFVCRRDGKPAKPCASPFRYKVRKGRHKLAVRAVDAAGNVDPTPAKDRFRVKRVRRR